MDKGVDARRINHEVFTNTVLGRPAPACRLLRSFNLTDSLFCAIFELSVINSNTELPKDKLPMTETNHTALPHTIQQAATQTIDDLELSPLSKRTYRHGLAAFMRFLREEKTSSRQTKIKADATKKNSPPYPIAKIDEETLAEFNRWLRRVYGGDHTEDVRRIRQTTQSRGDRTRKVYLVAAKHLMNWLDLHDLLPDGVSYERMVRRMTNARGKRRQGYRRRPVDPAVARVIAYYQEQELPEKRGQKRLILLRNRALVSFLYDTGVRISEALALTREDVLDGRAKRVRLVFTKNGRPRTVFLNDETRAAIRSYVKDRDDGPGAFLFVSHGRGKGGALTPAQAWNIIKRAAKAEGLYRNTSPHSLRHRRAQDLLDSGMPLEWVAALLGHEHPDTTRIVYAWDTDEKLLEDMLSTYGQSPSEAASKQS